MSLPERIKKLKEERTLLIENGKIREKQMDQVSQYTDYVQRWIGDMQSAMEKLESQIMLLLESLEGDEEDQESDIKAPEQIKSAEDVLKFVRWKIAMGEMTDEADQKLSPIGLMSFCRDVRNSLASIDRYGIERLNDQAEKHNYTASEEKHGDAIYFPNSSKAYDICKGSKEGGVFSQKVSFALIKVLPWEA